MFEIFQTEKSQTGKKKSSRFLFIDMKRCQEIFRKKIQVMTQHAKITIDMKL